MSKAILGKKLGMTQVFTEEGAVVPVTVVEASPNVVVRVKTVDTDGYNSIQLGYGEIKEKHLTKPVKGQFDKAGVAPVKYLREFRLTDTPEYTVGQTLAADIFAPARAKVLQVPSNVTVSTADRWVTAPNLIVNPVLSDL